MARLLGDCGLSELRAQYSVFECEISSEQWVNLKATLLKIYDVETDSLRFYHLGSKWKRKIEHHGAKPTPRLPARPTHPLIAKRWFSEISGRVSDTLTN
ncbi:MAG: CRISPR-associated endonuclease Cas2 [Methylococcales bacterium]